MSEENNQKSYIKLTIFYTFLTAGVIFLIAKFGITGAIRMSEFLQKRMNPEVSSDLYENVLPAPQLYPIAEATNSATLFISGFSQPNQKVDIYLNEFAIKTFEVDSEGKFSDFINLSLGLSNIYAVTKDSRGVQSPPSKSWTVFYSNSPPYLEIFEPANQSLLKKQSMINIKGKIANTSKVTINDHSAITDKDGNFSYPTKLEPGENKFKIVCSDPAQNKVELEWTLLFQP